MDRTERLSDGRLRVHLVNGLTLPVSRTFARAVREAGLGKGDRFLTAKSIVVYVPVLSLVTLHTKCWKQCSRRDDITDYLLSKEFKMNGKGDHEP